MQYLYLILSIYFGRRNPLYFLLFPIALVSGPGAFIDPRTVLFAGDNFLISSNVYKDIIIVYLIFIVFHLRDRWSFSLLWKTPMLIYAWYILALIGLTFAGSGFNYNAINVMRLFAHMILGYFLLILIFSTANSKQFISFFNTLFIATGILSICYVINSANIFPLFYQDNMFQEIEMDEVSFFRDFATIPYFGQLLFILALTLTLFKSKEYNRNAIYLSLITYPFVVLYSFTRSLLGSVLFESALIIVLLIIKSPNRILRISTLFIALAFWLILGIVQTKFESESNYFKERVDSAKEQGSETGNVQIRIAYVIKAYDILRANNSLLLGDGISKKHQQEMAALGAYEADSTIPFFLINTGILGVIIYYFISFYFLFRIVSQLKNLFNPFSLALFAFMLMSMISSIIMGGFSWGDPLIFYPFALVITIENLYKSYHPKRLHTK
ncbi:MAG TPA: hypothetical protein VFC65_00690 [Prolixibacteraceae bacterium]|nr:hypothetical protein [Prolixibacteraceae bacterium]